MRPEIELLSPEWFDWIEKDLNKHYPSIVKIDRELNRGRLVIHIDPVAGGYDPKLIRDGGDADAIWYVNLRSLETHFYMNPLYRCVCTFDGSPLYTFRRVK